MGILTNDERNLADSINSLAYEIVFTSISPTMLPKKKSELAEKLLQYVCFSQSSEGADIVSVIDENNPRPNMESEELDFKCNKKDKYQYDGIGLYNALKESLIQYEQGEVNKKTGKPFEFFDLFKMRYKLKIRGLAHTNYDIRSSEQTRANRACVRRFLRLIGEKYGIEADLPHNPLSAKQRESYFKSGNLSAEKIEEIEKKLFRELGYAVISPYEAGNGDSGNFDSENIPFGAADSQDRYKQAEVSDNASFMILNYLEDAMEQAENVKIKDFKLYVLYFLTATILCEQIEPDMYLRAYVDEGLEAYYKQYFYKKIISRIELVARYVGLQNDTVRKKFNKVQKFLIKLAYEWHFVRNWES